MRNYLFLLSFVVFGIILSSRANGQAPAWNVYVDSISQWANTEQPTVIDAQGNAWVLFWDNDSVSVGRFDGTGWTHYGPSDGVPVGNTHAIIRDHAGKIWMSADSGIAEFTDGTWHSYKIQDKLMGIRTYHALAADSNGNVWVATFANIVISQEVGGTFDSMWNELYRFDGSTWTSFTPPYIYNRYGFSDLSFAPDGTLWAGESEYIDSAHQVFMYGLWRYDRSSWQGFDVEQGTGVTAQPAGGGVMTVPGVTEVLPDKNGGVWVSVSSVDAYNTPPFALDYFNGSTWDTTGLSGRRFTDIWLAPNGDKYFRSNARNKNGNPIGDSGALVIVHSDGSLDSIQQSEIPFFPFSSIAFASDGTPWLTFDWAGSTRLGAGLETFMAPSGVTAPSSATQQDGIYPDPASASITVLTAKGSISIVDPLGRAMDVPRHGNSFDVSHLVGGVYFFRDQAGLRNFVVAR